MLHWAAECFVANERLLYFGNGRNNVAFLHGKIRPRIPIKRPEVSQSNKQKNTPTPPAQHFLFTTQIPCGHVSSRNQDLSPNEQGRRRRENLGTRLAIV